jgi:hypothetical protein
VPKWEFNKADLSDVDVGLTQRDQFNNDEVGLSDALVREVIQNSSDAPASAALVKVVFSFVTLTGSDRTEYESHLGHCCLTSRPARATRRLSATERYGFC